MGGACKKFHTKITQHIFHGGGREYMIFVCGGGGCGVGVGVGP